MQFSIKTNYWLLLSVLWLGSLIDLGNANKVLANPSKTGGKEAIAQTTTPEPARRNKPTFYEEEQDPKSRGDGFTQTFLRDAIGGVSNPLDGTGGSSTTVDSFQKAEFNAGGSEGPGTFNRTNVIIPPSVIPR